MSLITIILLAVALSIDACVVSFAHGLVLPDKRVRNSLMLALFTGVAQGIMPTIGYFSTQIVYKYVAPASKWLVFAIFLYLGIKFIQEAFEKDKEIPLCLSLQCLFMIAIATSIDALAAGVSISLTKTPILFPACLIACTTFMFALFGYWSGCCLKKFSTKYLEIFAGLVLIALALKSLF